MVVSDNAAALGVQQRVDALFAVHHVHNRAGARVLRRAADLHIAAKVLGLTHADDVLTLGVQAANRLRARGILVRGVHKAFVVDVNAGKFRRNEQLLLGAFFLRRQLAPELLPRRNFNGNRAEKAGEVAVRLKDHDAFKHVLRNAVDTSGVVHRDFQGRKEEVGIQHLAVRVDGHACDVLVAVQHNQAVVAVRDAELACAVERHALHAADFRERLIAAARIHAEDALRHRAVSVLHLHAVVLRRVQHRPVVIQHQHPSRAFLHAQALRAVPIHHRRCGNFRQALVLLAVFHRRHGGYAVRFGVQQQQRIILDRAQQLAGGLHDVDLAVLLAHNQVITRQLNAQNVLERRLFIL